MVVHPRNVAGLREDSSSRAASTSKKFLEIKIPVDFTLLMHYIVINIRIIKWIAWSI